MKWGKNHVLMKKDSLNMYSLLKQFSAGSLLSKSCKNKVEIKKT